MLANALRKALPDDTSITVVDRDDAHHYQPGYLFVPFGAYTPERVVRSRRAQLADGVGFLQQGVSRVDPQRHVVLLDGGDELAYDWLVIASGTTPQPAQTPGLLDDKVWRTSAFDFYTLDGAAALHDALANFEGGRLLVHITDMPIKCPVAPLEFAFLADDYFRKRRIRHKVDITYVTPLDGAFTKPVASAALGALLEDRSIRVAADFAISHVDPDTQTIVAYDGRALPFDLLVTVPPHTGADLRHRGRDECPDLQGRRGRSLRDRSPCGEPPSGYGGASPAEQVRRTRKLLRRIRAGQGAALGFQLRHRAVDGALPGAGCRTDEAARRIPPQPLGQARL